MSELEDVRRRLAEIDAELAGLGRTERAAEHREAMRQLRERFEQRFEALSRARDAAVALRRISSQQELLRQAPRALTSATAFRRAMLSLAQEGALVPVAVNFEPGPEESDTSALAAAELALSQLREQPIRLEHHMVESDVMRRRRASLVSDAELNARVDRRVAELLGWSSYVVAPLHSGAGVFGVLHADRGPGEQLDVLDRDVLGEFAGVLSQINESAELRRALRQDRSTLRGFIDRVTAVSVSLADAPITFSAYAHDQGPTAIEPAAGAGAEGLSGGGGPRDDRLVFAGLLTRRELDVLRLLADGGTNHSIADALVLSDTTVKFHVNSILRKLRVANRAQAVARYLSLLGLPSPV